jgi:hypothetical protein
MRHITIHRERALAAFALKYYCVFDRDSERFIAELEANEATARFAHVGDVSLRNGEKIRVGMDEEEHTFFAMIYTENKNIATNTVTVPAGTEDMAYQIITDYDGYRTLSFTIQPENLAEPTV